LQFKQLILDRSPALIPKPKDWNHHISIAGFYFLDLAQNYTPVGDVFARSVDIVVRGDGRLGVGYTVYNELKSWTAATLRSSRNRTVRRQVVYDLAILDPVVAGRGGLPRGIRWVFDRTKIGRKDTIIDTFVEVIQSDAYLRHRWGTDLPRIRQALDQFIELAP
jgi:hypothetical protein